MKIKYLNQVYVGLPSFVPHPKSLSPRERDFEADSPSPLLKEDAAGELFRNLARTAEGLPLVCFMVPNFGDFEDMLSQNWGLGGLKGLRLIANISKC